MKIKAYADVFRHKLTKLCKKIHKSKLDKGVKRKLIREAKMLRDTLKEISNED